MRKALPLFIEGVPRRGEGVEMRQELKDAAGGINKLLRHSVPPPL